jgi:hypothetical protein
MPGVQVDTINCRKPPSDELDRLRTEFANVTKPADIHDLATNHVEELLNAGFTHGDVKYMAESRKIPTRVGVTTYYPDGTQTTWTINVGLQFEGAPISVAVDAAGNIYLTNT